MYELIETVDGYARVKLGGDGRAFAAALARVKAIPGRRYDRESKTWLVPEDALGILDANDEDIVDGAIRCVHKNFLVDAKEAHLFSGRLIPFQTVGASFLYSMRRACLLDQFGLGKTMQAIRAVLKGSLDGEIRRTLVVTKSSLKAQWAAEIRRFTGLSCVVIGGSRAKRAKQWSAAADADVVAINYELLLQELDFRAAFAVAWDCIIADEAQMLRTRTAKRTRALLKLRSKHFYVLTATPVQNRPEEIYSIFKFINPAVLGKWKDFESDYIRYDAFYNPIAYVNLEDLGAKIAPYILKRTVEDVGEQLPEMSRVVYEVEMNSLQRQLHRGLSAEYEAAKVEYEDMLAKIITESPSDKLTELAELKKAKMLGLLNLMIEVCDAPELLAMSESKSVRQRVSGVSQATLAASPKLKELMDIIADFVENGEKIVVFSQYPRMLSIIACRLDAAGTGYAMLYGQMGSTCPEGSSDCGACARFTKCGLRPKSVWRFWNEPECMVFLSTDAGGAGLNLQCASCLVNYDLPWNPSDADQRNGRIRRIGSRYSAIRIIDMVVADGLDKTMLAVHARKRGVIDAILEPSEEEKRMIRAVTERLTAI